MKMSRSTAAYMATLQSRISLLKLLTLFVTVVFPFLRLLASLAF